jgi:Zn-dependent M28 family amino/carboxypeptidase
MSFNSGLGIQSVVNTDLTFNSDLYFNKTKAYELIEDQVQFGSRIPGSEAIENTRRMVVHTVNIDGLWEIENQNFSKEWIEGENISLVNMILTPIINNQNQSYFLLLAHYDSRRWADQDTNPALKENPVLGANDGASGVAVALELGRVLITKHEITNFKIILFDAEDQGNIGWNWLIGSRHYVNSELFRQEEISFAILFDMVGGHDAIFKREGFSEKYAQSLVSKIWNLADKINYNQYFVNKSWSKITDDHLPFIEKGVPAVDIIDDFISNYKAWHTTSDTIDQISPETLNAVGQTVEAFLLEIHQNTESNLILPSFTFQTTVSIWNIILPLLVLVIPKFYCRKA